jgi:tripartite-type tricarboxylate transporter receptor subunit TctC
MCRRLASQCAFGSSFSPNKDDLVSRRLHFWIAALIGTTAQNALAADYPAKPVRIIVPFLPGAAADAVTRVIARKLTDYWGKQVILDNRPGVPGVQVAATAPADGGIRRAGF